MIEAGGATADEMTLAFLRAEIDPHASSWALYADVLTKMCTDKASLIDTGDPKDARQNDARRALLNAGRGGLMRGFPRDTVWRRVIVSPDEMKRFQFIKLDVWIKLSGGTRLVGDGVKNLDQPQNADILAKVAGISARLRRGDVLQPMIAAQHAGLDKIVLLEGHHRATAYAHCGLPNEIPLFLGTSAHMIDWHWY
jgi:hypothetical protein